MSVKGVSKVKARYVYCKWWGNMFTRKRKSDGWFLPVRCLALPLRTAFLRNSVQQLYFISGFIRAGAFQGPLSKATEALCPWSLTVEFLDTIDSCPHDDVIFKAGL